MCKGKMTPDRISKVMGSAFISVNLTSVIVQLNLHMYAVIVASRHNKLSTQ